MIDEEFLEQFARLNPAEGSSEPVTLNATGLVNRDLALCAIARIVTERGMVESNFPATMRRAWASHPDTEFVHLARNIFLIQFTGATELHKVMYRGIWSYRGDVVALKRVADPSDLMMPSVSRMEVWTQFHRIPAHVITNAGIRSLAEQIGTPLTDAEEAYSSGVRYCRVKISIALDKPLKETVSFLHPALGVFTIYTTYERITKICGCCARVDHEISACPDQIRFDTLRQDPRFRDRPELKGLTGRRVAPWLTDSGLIPRAEQGRPTQAQSNNHNPNGPNYASNHNSQSNTAFQTQPILQEQLQPRTRLRQPRESTNPILTNEGLSFSSPFVGPDLNHMAGGLNPTLHTTQLNSVQTLVHQLETTEGSKSGSKRAGKEHMTFPTELLERDGQQSIPASKKRAVEATQEASPPTI